MLVTFTNNHEEEDTHGPYKLTFLPDPGELVGIHRGRDTEPTVYLVVSREYIFKNPHHQPEVTVFIEESA